MSLTRLLRGAATTAVAARLARGLAARPPVQRRDGDRVTDRAIDAVTVVVPARDEADRIRPLLAALRQAPGVDAVIVVDDGSNDATAWVARQSGARVVTAGEPPHGWSGKTWALRQGVEAATSEWVVTLDADVIPDPGLPGAVVGRAVADRLDLLTVAGRAELPAGVPRWLYAAMLAQLVYRFGPPGTSRRLANGQCMAAPRTVLLDGISAVRGALVEDVALVRHLLAAGGRVDFLDATGLMVVRPYGSARDVWSGWGRSIGLRGIEPRWRTTIEVGVLALTLPLPLLRVVTGRGDAVDTAAVVLRVGTLFGMRRAHLGRGIGYWASPLADAPALAATISGLVRRSPTWRGRRVAVRASRLRSRTAVPRTS